MNISWRWEDDLRDEAIELMIREPRPEVDEDALTDESKERQEDERE